VASGESDPGGRVLALAASLGAGAAVGALFHVIEQWLNLLVIFPALMGLAAGLAGAAVVKAKRVRAPFAAALIGLAGGAVAYLTGFAIGYARVRADMAKDLDAVVAAVSRDAGAPPPATLDVDHAVDRLLLAWAEAGDDPPPSDSAVADALLGDERGVPLPARGAALIAWLRVTAAAGTDITHGVSSSSSHPLHLGGTATGVLWAVELLIAAVIGLAVTGAAARVPFCEQCGTWYGPPEALVVVAGKEEQAAVSRALENADPVALAALAAGARSALPTLGVVGLRARHCTRCPDADTYVQLIRFKRDRRGRGEEKVLRSGLFPAVTWRALSAPLTDAARFAALGASPTSSRPWPPDLSPPTT
jgi:hypothetical protein